MKELRTPSPNNHQLSKEVILNHRMSNLNCAVVLAQLERIEELIAKRRRIAQLYYQYFSGLEDLEDIDLFQEKEYCVYWRYQILLKENYPLLRILRKDLCQKLYENQIEVRPIFSLMHKSSLYKEMDSYLEFPNAENISLRALDIPISPCLTDEKARKVAQYILDPEKLL